MNNKIIGVVLLIVGTGLALWGYDIYDSAGAQVSRALGGDTPAKAWAAMIGGGICIVLGVLKVK